ncbi:MAG: ABC transporter ATP-binding protein [Mycoplasmataceae bacterium]|nr:ABC transporter ATP-binding protein [Mycoplasmataceae bacterium]
MKILKKILNYKKKHQKYYEKDISEYERTPENKKPVLFVRNLTKKYFGRKMPAINNISFNVYPGQFHAFIGANGAGKTTTIKAIIGAYSKWSGTILINGVKNNKEIAKKMIGYIPENARFPENFSALKYLEWTVTLSGISMREAKKIAEEKLKELKMWNLRKKSPNGFSSGQKKKILLAQALIHNPDIIIMDEPVANLDPKARSDFFNLLVELAKKGKAILISSHVLAELDLYFDSATILDGGKIIFSGSSEKLFEIFSKNRYLCEVDNEKKFISIIKKTKIKFIKKNNQNCNEYILTIPNKGDVLKLQKSLTTNKITINNFSKIQPSLEEIYDKLVIKGSVDTMKHETKKIHHV